MNLPAVPVIAVASGKGGVGKSTVILTLARALTETGVTVGLVDADLYGPDIPRMLGIRRDAPARWLRVVEFGDTPGRKLEVVEVEGIQVASVGFLVGDTQGIAVGSGIAEMLLTRLFRDTQWHSPHVLLVDLPPGTADVLQSLPRVARNITALLVVTPAETAHLDSARLITILDRLRIPILGGVENMAYVDCPDCSHQFALHTEAPPDRTIWGRGVTKMASLPYRPDRSLSTDDLTAITSAVHAHLADFNRT